MKLAPEPSPNLDDFAAKFGSSGPPSLLRSFGETETVAKSR